MDASKPSQSQRLETTENQKSQTTHSLETKETKSDYWGLMLAFDLAKKERERQEIMQHIVRTLGSSDLFDDEAVRLHTLVSLKELRNQSDVRRSLSLNNADVESKIIPRLKNHEKIDKGIPVTVYGKDGRPYDMEIKRWGLRYVLRGQWHHFCKKQALHVGDTILLWLFHERHPTTRHLRFVVAPRTHALQNGDTVSDLFAENGWEALRHENQSLES